MSAPALSDLDQRYLRVGVALEKIRRRARDYFYAFGPTCVRDAGNIPIELAPIHLSWIAHVNYAWERGLHAGIFAPMGHGKSAGFAIPLAAWLIGRNPQVRIKIICAADNAAAERVSACKQLLESEAYKEIFPFVAPGKKWTDHVLFVDRAGAAIDPTLEGRGVFTKGVGGRANYLFFDDVCDLGNSSEFLQRERVKTFVTKQWMTRLDRLDPGARALWIATPWSLADASYALRASPKWCWLEQRVEPGNGSYEQEVWNAGPDYLDYVSQQIGAMRSAA